jgi:PhnB protein
MSTYLAPYINFQGRARQAMEHYHRVLGGKLEMFAADDQGRPTPAGPDDRIMYARLDFAGLVIIASDGSPKYPARSASTSASPSAAPTAPG